MCNGGQGRVTWISGNKTVTPLLLPCVLAADQEAQHFYSCFGHQLPTRSIAQFSVYLGAAIWWFIQEALQVLSLQFCIFMETIGFRVLNDDPIQKSEETRK